MGEVSVEGVEVVVVVLEEVSMTGEGARAGLGGGGGGREAVVAGAGAEVVTVGAVTVDERLVSSNELKLTVPPMNPLGPKSRP